MFCDETCNPFFGHSANVTIGSEAVLDTRKEQVNIKNILPYMTECAAYGILF